MGARGDESALKSSSAMPLYGQMGLRSGPLAPTSAKLTTQYLVLDHMTNHYSKIIKAKPIIDNRPPNSLQTSQKARDRQTRENVYKSSKRLTSAAKTRRSHSTTGYYHEDIYDENLWGIPEDEEDLLIHDIMRKTLHRRNIETLRDTYGTQSSDSAGFQQYRKIPRQSPSSARSQTSMRSVASYTMVPTKVKTYDGDILEKRSHVFTEGKPFTPRTLKTDRKSRLSQYKYYNKVGPKDNTTQQPLKQQHEQGSEDKTETQVTPSPPMSQSQTNRQLDKTREGPVTMNSLMFETLHSRDFSKYDQGDSNHSVPKLDISMDTDHLKWIQGRAVKGQGWTQSENIKSTMHVEDRYNNSVDFGKTGEMSITYGSLGSTKTRRLAASQKLMQEDEEFEYVRFMKDMTNEALDRGIYTDRSLRHIFGNHIARNTGRLNELRMRRITDEIRQELNIPRYDTGYDHASDIILATTTEWETRHDGNGGSHSSHFTDEKINKNINSLDSESEMAGTLETSMKSKASEISTEPSVDSYSFVSTGDEDLCSTIPSSMDKICISESLTLKTYQARINEMDKLEAREITLTSSHDSHHSDRQVQVGQVQVGQVQVGQVQVGQMQVGQLQVGQVQVGQMQVGQLQVGQVQVGQVQVGQVQAGQMQVGQNHEYEGQMQVGHNHEHEGQVQVGHDHEHEEQEQHTEDQNSHDEEYQYEDNYDDDGDIGEDHHQTSEPSALYRTDDDDF